MANARVVPGKTTELQDVDGVLTSVEVDGFHVVEDVGGKTVVVAEFHAEQEHAAHDYAHRIEGAAR